MLNELQYLLKMHSDHEALSDQSSLRDLVTDLRLLAADLGLDFQSALVGASAEYDTLPSFDPCI